MEAREKVVVSLGKVGEVQGKVADAPGNVLEALWKVEEDL
jgi:hypothetical protein